MALNVGITSTADVEQCARSNYICSAGEGSVGTKEDDAVGAML